MKKLFDCILTVILTLALLNSCNSHKKPGYDPSLQCERYENCAVFTFDDFADRSTASFELERVLQGEGKIYYQVNLEQGALSIKYTDDGISNATQPLSDFTADDEMPVNGSGGYIEGDIITVTFESLSPVCGEIIIAFTEDALRATNNDIQLHRHTYFYETLEDVHRLIYTCDCDWLETKKFEQHYDDDRDGNCDECRYYIGIQHEDHYWEYDVNEFSHRQIFGCGCESPEEYEFHENHDGDDLCDACGYQINGHK